MATELDFNMNGIDLHAALIPNRLTMGENMYQISFADGRPMAVTTGRPSLPLETVVTNFMVNGF
jgi:hypothetical protein